MSTKDDVKKLLAAGFSRIKVADMLNLKQGFIDTLLKDTKFAAEVEKEVTRRALGNIERDDRIDSLHDEVLTRMEDVVPYLEKPAMVLKAFQLINGAKLERDKRNLEQGTGGNAGKVVNIILPSHLMVHAVQHEVNANNEVVIVDSKPMVTMNSKEVTKLVDKAKAAETVADSTSFRLNGREFNLSDLDVFGDGIGIINQNINNLDLSSIRRNKRDEAKLSDWNSIVEEGQFVQVREPDFTVSIDGDIKEDFLVLEKLFNEAKAANIAEGLTKA